MTQRIGIYSGTFDPIHAGHIAFGTTALHIHGLDKVVFVPEANPRGKSFVTALEHRLVMTKQATDPHENLETLTLQSPQFSIANTLPELQLLFPGAQLSLLIGSDIARTLMYRWEGLELLEGVRFIVGMRRNDTVEEIEAIAEQLRSRYQIELSLVPVQETTGHASSSTIRSGDMSHLPAEIVPYVTLNNLYS